LCYSVQANGPASNGLWYYQIGGAKPIRAPANPSVTSIKVDGNGQLSMGYSCGKFDPLASIAHTLNQVKDGADNVVKAMVNAATGAISSLPALILQRANPGLYDLMQNSLIRAELQLDVATKSCEQIESAIANGQNPYQDLLVISRANAWKRELGFGSTTAATAKKNVDKSKGSEGVPWIYGTPAGGDSQPEIKVTSDLAVAGYNLTLNRNLGDLSNPSSSNDKPITKIWASPQESKDWIAETFGEHILTTCESCTKQSVPGRGLLPEINTEQQQLSQDLKALTTSTDPLTITKLDEVSAPGLHITREVIEGLRQLPEPDRSLYRERLASDIALSRTLEKTMYARRLLSSARQLPEAESLPMVQEHARRTIDEIDREMDRLLFEHQARRTILSDTVSSLLLRVQQRRVLSLSIPEQGVRNDDPLMDGRVVDP